MIILSILIFVIVSLTLSTSKNKFNNLNLESHKIEIFWTILPSFILIFIGVPSIKTLYLIEENSLPILTIKTIGYQWYWSYEYSNFLNKKNISIILTSTKVYSELPSNKIIVPNITPTRLIITSKDVLHSWAIPSLGVKVDAIPGRLNQCLLVIKRPSILIGQCSEICGAGHRFIPILIESPSIKSFIKKIRQYYFKKLKAMDF